MTDHLTHLVELVDSAATLKERTRIIKILLDRKIIQDSSLGPEWIVAYSVNGPIDVKMSELLGGEVE